MNKRIKKTIFIIIFLSIYLIVNSQKLFARTIDTNIDGIDDSLYPRYKISN